MRASVPGHGGGPFVPRALRAALRLASVTAWDLTEWPGLDDLAHPSGPIAFAEQRMAESLGAAGSALLVNGSTAGLAATVLALAGEGDAVAFPVGSHRSVYAAVALARATPLLLAERRDPRAGYPVGPDPQGLRRLVSCKPALVCLTYPTYHGVAFDLAPWVAACRAHGIPLLVDSAHGAHFGLEPRLPDPALRAGADVVVLGFHKTMGSLTQSAVLAWRQETTGARIRPFLRLLQSSSPSYLLMASLDAARAAMGEASSRWARAIDRSLAVRERWAHLVWTPEPNVAFDPTRVTVVSASHRGTEVARTLLTHGIAYEYADDVGVLLLLGPGVPAAGVARLEKALAALPSKRTGEGRFDPDAPVGASRATVPTTEGRAFVLPMLTALRCGGRPVPVDDAAGHIAQDFVAPYPPGIPWLIPGERVPAEVAQALGRLWRAGFEVHGITKEGTMKVIDEATTREQ